MKNPIFSCSFARHTNRDLPLLISFQNIELSFSGKIILAEASFNIATGDKLVFSGSSGAGKTSLLNTLTGFVRPSKGRVFFKNELLDSTSLKTLRKASAYLPQQLIFSNFIVKDFLYLPFTFKQNQSTIPSEEKIMEYFSIFDLSPGLMESKIQDISGGEKQRIALISCLLLQREILLLDEPTSALDNKSKGKVMDFLFDKPELTIISCSHDPDWIARCDKIVNL